MCGRYTLTSVDGLIEEFSLVQMSLELAPRYNIAPSTPVPVVDNRAPGARTLTLMRWGLVPRWAKDPAIGNKMINARGETAAVKPAFRDAFRRRRCLIVADGFYEWQRAGKLKVPFYIRRRSQEPMAFAGLWERWQPPDGDPLLSCTIITTGANDLLAPVHDRMPVILERADYDAWLDPEPAAPGTLDHLLATPATDDLEMFEVSRLVNSPKNDLPQCIEPAARQGALFS